MLYLIVLSTVESRFYNITLSTDQVILMMKCNEGGILCMYSDVMCCHMTAEHTHRCASQGHSFV